MRKPFREHEVLAALGQALGEVLLAASNPEVQ
jgi:hypothetical protein